MIQHVLTQFILLVLA